MITTILGIVQKELDSIDIPYEYMGWTSNVTYPYFVGEYTEIVTNNEDGYKEYTIMLTGTTVDSWLSLEQHRAKIEDHFPDIGGLRITDALGVVVIFYENSFPVPTDEANLKRIQINLRIKSWKGLN